MVNEARGNTAFLLIGYDGDGDLIPDAWERGHTNDLAVLGDADADGDGFPDRSEYLADTDPFNASIYPEASFYQAGGSNVVAWAGVPTRAYEVEFTPDLMHSNWTVVGESRVPVSEQGIEMRFDAVDTNGFYRLKAAPPLQ